MYFISCRKFLIFIVYLSICLVLIRHENVYSAFGGITCHYCDHGDNEVEMLTYTCDDQGANFSNTLRYGNWAGWWPPFGNSYEIKEYFWQLSEKEKTTVMNVTNTHDNICHYVIEHSMDSEPIPYYAVTKAIKIIGSYHYNYLSTFMGHEIYGARGKLLRATEKEIKENYTAESMSRQYYMYSKFDWLYKHKNLKYGNGLVKFGYSGYLIPRHIRIHMRNIYNYSDYGRAKALARGKTIEIGVSSKKYSTSIIVDNRFETARPLRKKIHGTEHEYAYYYTAAVSVVDGQLYGKLLNYAVIDIRSYKYSKDEDNKHTAVALLTGSNCGVYGSIENEGTLKATGDYSQYALYVRNLKPMGLVQNKGKIFGDINIYGSGSLINYENAKIESAMICLFEEVKLKNYGNIEISVYLLGSGYVENQGTIEAESYITFSKGGKNTSTGKITTKGLCIENNSFENWGKLTITSSDEYDSKYFEKIISKPGSSLHVNEIYLNSKAKKILIKGAEIFAKTIYFKNDLENNTEITVDKIKSYGLNQKLTNNKGGDIYINNEADILIDNYGTIYIKQKNVEINKVITNQKGGTIVLSRGFDFNWDNKGNRNTISANKDLIRTYSDIKLYSDSYGNHKVWHNKSKLETETKLTIENSKLNNSGTIYTRVLQMTHTLFNTGNINISLDYNQDNLFGDINNKGNILLRQYHNQTNKRQKFSGYLSDGGDIIVNISDYRFNKDINEPFVYFTKEANFKNNSSISLISHNPMLKPSELNTTRDSKVILVRSEGGFKGEVLNKKILRQKIFKVNNYITSLKHVLFLGNIKFVKSNGYTDITATARWYPVSDKLQSKIDDFTDMQTIRDLLNLNIPGLYIYEQDNKMLYDIVNGRIINIGDSKEEIGINLNLSTEYASQTSAIKLEIDKDIKIDKIDIIGKINARLATNGTSVSRDGIKITATNATFKLLNFYDDRIKATAAYLTKMPRLSLAEININGDIDAGRDAIIIDTPVVPSSKITNNKIISAKKNAIKFTGLTSLIYGTILNKGTITGENAVYSDNHGITEKLDTSKQLIIENQGYIEGKLQICGNTTIRNSGNLGSNSKKYDINADYGMLAIENQPSGSIYTRKITYDINAATLTITNSNIINCDEEIIAKKIINSSDGVIQTKNLKTIDSLYNLSGATLEVANLDTQGDFKNTGVIRVDNIQLDKITNIENQGKIYLAKDIKLANLKNITFKNLSAALLKTQETFRNQYFNIENKNSVLAINSKETISNKFGNYDSEAGVLKICIPDDQKYISPEIPLASFKDTKLANLSDSVSKIALYADNPIIADYEQPVTILEADAINGNSLDPATIIKFNKVFHGFDNGKVVNLMKPIIIITEPQIVSKRGKFQIKASIRWWKIAGDFPKLDKFNLYSMEDALLSALPFISGLSVKEYDGNKHFYIAKRVVHLGKISELDTGENIYAAKPDSSKNINSAVDITVNYPETLNIKAISVEKAIDASKYLADNGNYEATINKSALCILGSKDLVIENGINIDFEGKLISSKKSSQPQAYKVAALLIANTITSDINNQGEISGLNGITILGGVNTLVGTITNNSTIDVVQNIIYADTSKPYKKTKKIFNFINSPAAIATGGSCVLAGGDIKILNQGYLAISSLTCNSAIIKIDNANVNNTLGIMNIDYIQTNNATVTLTNAGEFVSANEITLTSLQNEGVIKLNKINLALNSYNKYRMKANILNNNNMFINNSGANLEVVGFDGLKINDNNFQNLGELKVAHILELSGYFTNNGSITADIVKTNNNIFTNSQNKYLQISGKDGLDITGDVINKGYIRVINNLKVSFNYAEGGNWKVGGINIDLGRSFTNKSQCTFHIDTEDLTVKMKDSFKNKGNLIVTNKIILEAEMNNDGTVKADTLCGNKLLVKYVNNAKSEFSNLENITIKNNNKLNITKSISDKVEVTGELINLTADVLQQGEFIVDSVKADKTFDIYGTVVAGGTITAQKLVVNNTATVKVTKALNVSDAIINQGTITANTIKLPDRMIQQNYLEVTGDNGLNLDKHIENTGKIKITKTLNVKLDDSFSGTIIADKLVIDKKHQLELAADAKAYFNNLGEDNHHTIIINQGVLQVKDGDIKGNVAIHSNDSMNHDGVIKTDGNLKQNKNSKLSLSTLSVINDAKYTIEKNADVVFNAVINQPSLTINNAGNLSLLRGSSFSKYISNAGTITTSVDKFTQSTKQTSLLIVKDITFTPGKKLKFVLNSIFDESLIFDNVFHKKYDLYLMHITNEAYREGVNNREIAIPIKSKPNTLGDINNYIDISSAGADRISFVIASTITMEAAGTSIQSGERYLKVLISPTITYDFKDPDMKFGQQEIYNNLANKIEQKYLLWGVMWGYNKQNNQVTNNNIMISPYYLFTEKHYIDYKNQILQIGTNSADVIYTNNKKSPACVIGSNIFGLQDHTTNPVVELKSIKIYKLTITGRISNYFNPNNMNQDALLITGKNKIKLTDSITIQPDVKLVAGNTHHALHIDANVDGSINNQGMIGDNESGCGLYISHPSSLTLINNHQLIGKSAIKIEVSSSHKDAVKLYIKNNSEIDGNIIANKTTSSNSKLSINNAQGANINSDKIISNGFITNINNAGIITVQDEFLVNYLTNTNSFIMTSEKTFTVNNNLSNTGSLNIKKIELKQNFSCSGDIISNEIFGNGKILNNSGNNTFATINNITLNGYNSLIVKKLIKGKVVIQKDLTLGANIAVDDDADLTLAQAIKYQSNTITNRGKVTVTASQLKITQQNFINYSQACLQAQQLFITNDFSVNGTIDVQELSTNGNKLTIDSEGVLKLDKLTNRSSNLLELEAKGKLYLGNSSQVNIEGDVDLSNNETANNILIQKDLKQNRGSLQITEFNNPQLITFSIANTANINFIKEINKDTLSIINAGTFSLCENSTLNAYTGNKNSNLNITCFTDFGLIDSEILNFKGSVKFDNSVKINLMVSKVSPLPIQRRTRINLIKSNYQLLTGTGVNLDNKTANNLFTIATVKNRTIQVIPNSVMLEQGGKILSAELELIDLSLLPKGSYKYDIAINKDLLGATHDENLYLNGICWSDPQKVTEFLTIGPYYMSAYSGLINYNNQELTIGKNTNDKTIKVEDYRSPAVVIAMTAKKTTDTLSIKKIGIVNQLIDGFNFAYRNKNFRYAKQDGMLIAGTGTLEITDELHIDENSDIIAGSENHALHLALNIKGKIKNSGRVGEKQTGYGIKISQPIDATLTNAKTGIIRGKIAAIEVSSTANTGTVNLSIENYGKIFGSITAYANKPDRVSNINLENKSSAIITASSLTSYNRNIAFNITNETDGIINISQAFVASRIINHGIMNITVENISLSRLDNYNIFNANNLVIETRGMSFNNYNKVNLTGLLSLKTNLAKAGTITAHKLCGYNTCRIDFLDYGRFEVLDGVTVASATVLQVSSKINDNVDIQDNNLTIISDIEQTGTFKSRGKVIGDHSLNIKGKAIVNNIDIKKLNVSAQGNLTVKNIITQEFYNHGYVTTDYINSEVIEQHDVLTITGSKNINISNSFINKGTIEINNAAINFTKSVKTDGYLKVNKLIAESSSSIVRIDAAKNSKLKIDTELGNTKSADIIFVNSGSIIIGTGKTASIVSNVSVYQDNYYPDLKANGVLCIDGYIYNRCNLLAGGLYANNRSTFEVQSNSVAVFNKPLQQPNLTIVNHSTLEIAQGSKIDSYTSDSNSCLMISVMKITDNTKAKTQKPLFTVDAVANFATNSSLILKAENNRLPSIKNQKIYLLTANNLKNIDGSKLTKSNIFSINNSIINNSLLLKLSDLAIENNNLIVAKLSIERQYKDKSIKAAELKLLKNLLGDCLEQDKLVLGASWQQEEGGNLFFSPDLLVLDNVAAVVQDSTDDLSRLVVNGNFSQQNTIYANFNLPAIVIGTTIKAATDQDLILDTIRLKNLDINSAYSSGVFSNTNANVATDQDGIVITGKNKMVLYDSKGIDIASSVKINAGTNSHALHLAAPIVSKLINKGNVGTKDSGYGLAISQYFKGDIKNYGDISGNKAAIIINQLTNDVGDIKIVNYHNITGNLMIIGATGITGPPIEVTNTSVIIGDIVSHKLDCNLVNVASGNITAQEISVTSIENFGNINTSRLFYNNIINHQNLIATDLNWNNSLINYGTLEITNKLVLTEDIINFGNVNALTIDGNNYNLSHSLGTIIANELKNIHILDKSQVIIKENISEKVIINNTLTIGDKVEIAAKAELSVGYLDFIKNATLKNYGKIIITGDSLLLTDKIINETQATILCTDNHSIVLKSSFTNLGIIKADYLFGNKQELYNKGELECKNLGKSDDVIKIYNTGILRLSDSLEKKISLNGDIYIYGSEKNYNLEFSAFVFLSFFLPWTSCHSLIRFSSDNDTSTSCDCIGKLQTSFYVMQQP